MLVIYARNDLCTCTQLIIHNLDLVYTEGDLEHEKLRDGDVRIDRQVKGVMKNKHLDKNKQNVVLTFYFEMHRKFYRSPVLIYYLGGMRTRTEI